MTNNSGLASLTPTATQLATLHEGLTRDLRASAPMAWQWAEQYCPQAVTAFTGCRSYHQVWQVMLLLGKSTSMLKDTGFLVGRFRQQRRQDRFNRVLISGAADYGTLARIFWADELDGVETDITLVDRCETTLRLNQWYAKQQGRSINTVQADVLKYQSPTLFDCITTHSFLGWFAATDRALLVAKWASLLECQGTVITNKRIRSGSESHPDQKFTAAEATAFGEELGQLAAELANPLELSLTQICQAGENYALSHKRFAMNSVTNLQNLFLHAGFNICETDVDGSSDLPSGPLAGAGARVRIVAQRL